MTVDLRVIAQRLTSLGLTLSLAESCTGGLVSKLITDIPGSSAFYKYGIVAYSNDAKLQFLGVKPETLSAHGAVSRETAEEMAEGVRKAGSTDIGIGITGIAGPGSDNTSKPVGLISFLSRRLFGHKGIQNPSAAMLEPRTETLPPTRLENFEFEQF